MKDLRTALVEKSVNLERFYRTHGGAGDVTLIVSLDAALEAVADAPRIYRGEEIKDAPDGLYAFPSLFKPRSVLVWCLDEVVGMMNAEPTAYPWAFGPLPDWLVFDIPTNSPSEGKG